MNRAELIEKCQAAAHEVAKGNYYIDTKMKITTEEMATVIMDTIFAAMREPTEAMFGAGNQSRKAGNSAYGNSRSTWQAMLSASPLAPEGGGT